MKKIYLTLILGIFLLSFTSALSELPPVKQGECIELFQYCPTCTYVNWTGMIYPDNTINLSVNLQMTKTNTNYNYTFCDTEQLGEYHYFVTGDKNSQVQQEEILFSVTPTGTDLNESQSKVILISMIVMFLFAGLLILLTFRITNGVVITMLYGIAIIILFMATLFSMTLIDNFVYNTVAIDGYTAYVMVFKILLSMSVLGLVLYAGLRALKLYKMKRGMIDD